MVKPLNSFHISKILAFVSLAPLLAYAQDDWRFNSSITAMTGRYTDSQTMTSQTGTGIRLLGEKKQEWGLAAGVQSTRIDMNPITQVSKQNQDNWLLSSFVHTQSTTLPGRWTLQLDAHKVSNDAPQSISSDVRAVAPQVSWLSYSQPMKFDFSYAHSNYKNTMHVHQISSALAYGFNNAADWLQLRGYIISNLDPMTALGQTRTHATDIKLTHFFNSDVIWAPTTVTLGLERGKRIYVVDMLSQTVYNLPMLNEGGENIAASWKVNSATNFNLQYSKNKYFADRITEHRFTLGTLSAQLALAW